jgi:hypothetical protein
MIICCPEITVHCVGLEWDRCVVGVVVGVVVTVNIMFAETCIAFGGVFPLPPPSGSGDLASHASAPQQHRWRVPHDHVTAEGPDHARACPAPAVSPPPGPARSLSDVTRRCLTWDWGSASCYCATL